MNMEGYEEHRMKAVVKIMHELAIDTTLSRYCVLGCCFPSRKVRSCVWF